MVNLRHTCLGYVIPKGVWHTCKTSNLKKWITLWYLVLTPSKLHMLSVIFLSFYEKPIDRSIVVSVKCILRYLKGHYIPWFGYSINRLSVLISMLNLMLTGSGAQIIIVSRHVHVISYFMDSTLSIGVSRSITPFLVPVQWPSIML